MSQCTKRKMTVLNHFCWYQRDLIPSGSHKKQHNLMKNVTFSLNRRTRISQRPLKFWRIWSFHWTAGCEARHWVYRNVQKSLRRTVVEAWVSISCQLAFPTPASQPMVNVLQRGRHVDRDYGSSLPNVPIISSTANLTCFLPSWSYIEFVFRGFVSILTFWIW